MTAGLQGTSIALDPQDALATDLEVFLSIAGIVEDSILVASNHFGHYTSNWIPFAGPASSVAIGAVDPGPPASSSELTEFTLNDSTLHLSCTLGASSFCGMFTDIIPEIEDNPLSFAAFDQIVFWAKQTQQELCRLLNLNLKPLLVCSTRQCFK